MNYSFSFSVGIDISKDYFDVAVLNFASHELKISGRFPNNSKGSEALLNWLKKHKIESAQCLFCMEATGIYSDPLADLLSKKALHVWVGHPYSMSKVMSEQRGKEDSLDALKIAHYAIRYRDKFRAYSPLPEALKEIRYLFRIRSLLVKTHKQLKAYLKSEQFGERSLCAELSALLSPTQEAKKATIKFIEKKIIEVMKQDGRLWRVFKHAQSVKGVGFVTAVYLLIITRGFTRFNSVKELACYCGIVPFPHKSGSSIQRGNKVHPASNKKLKSLLHMCALSAVQNDPELKAFYERRLALGKNKMSELNVIRNKILSRIWSCVRGQRNYVPRPQGTSRPGEQKRAA